MPHRIINRINAALDRWCPEKRLFLKSENGTRFVRLRPLTQVMIGTGVVLVLGWSVVATSVLAIDAVSRGDPLSQGSRAQTAFEQRLAALGAERDARAAEALAAQARFASALEQVSQMQGQLLASEERRRELETGLNVVQGTLRTAMAERDAARLDLAAQTSPQTGKTSGTYMAELGTMLDAISHELSTAAAQRRQAVDEAAKAKTALSKVEAERDDIIAHNDAVLARIEDALTLSSEPLNRVFRNIGMDPDKVLAMVRENYSGQGGPLTPMGYSSSGNADITATDAKAKRILFSLDKITTYSIATNKLPLDMPVKSAFRYTSPFGRRWGRMHAGVDMAGPIGTPIYATGDGVVVFAGVQSGYGRVIKIKHALGTQTVYGHLNRIGVKVGQKVSRGARIGDMGNTGRSTGPHLHYEVRVDGKPVNPMRFIKAAQDVH